MHGSRQPRKLSHCDSGICSRLEGGRIHHRAAGRRSRGPGAVQFRSIPVTRERRGHVGYYLVDRGRQVLQKRIEYRAKGFKQITEAFHDAPELLYFISLEVLIVAIMAFVVSGLRVGVPLAAATLLLLLPASEAALEIVNQLVTFLISRASLAEAGFLQRNSARLRNHGGYPHVADQRRSNP